MALALRRSGFYDGPHQGAFPREVQSYEVLAIATGLAGMGPELYLPIAGQSVDVAVLVIAGAAVGFLSGLFGVGGGFLITPLLMFLGIPPDVAIASGASQAAATSASSAMSHWGLGNVDLQLGLTLLVSGVAGSAIGVVFAQALRSVGQFELAVSLSYVILLCTIGSFMLIETVAAFRSVSAARKAPMLGNPPPPWARALPWKVRFPRSRLRISILLPVGIGLFVGFLSALMGVGGGFVLVPALVYIVRLRTSLAIGTSAFQIVFVSAFTTIMQAVSSHSLDLLLSMVLVIGGVIGSHFGTRAGGAIKGEQLRFLFALLILGVGLRVGSDLVLTPAELFSLRSFMP